MRSSLLTVAIVSTILLAGCQTSGLMSEEWVDIGSDHAKLDLTDALYGVDTHSIEAKADWRQYSELHVFRDSGYYGEAWLGALQSRWQWNATDNPSDFRQQLAKWNRFKDTPPELGRIRKESMDQGPLVYSIGRHKQDDCLYLMRFLNRNFSDDTKYRVQVVGYICRTSGDRFSEDEALTLLEKMTVRNTSYNGTGIPKEALVNAN